MVELMSSPFLATSSCVTNSVILDGWFAMVVPASKHAVILATEGKATLTD
jgi:hypothetical protein